MIDSSCARCIGGGLEKHYVSDTTNTWNLVYYKCVNCGTEYWEKKEPCPG